MTARSILRQTPKAARSTWDRAAFYKRVGYSLLVALMTGAHVSGYVVWVEDAKTPEGGWVAIIVTVGVSLLMLRWTK